MSVQVRHIGALLVIGSLFLALLPSTFADTTGSGSTFTSSGGLLPYQRALLLREKMNKLESKHGLFEVQWGSLSHELRNCLKYEIKASIEENRAPVRTNCTSDKLEIEGELHVSSGSLKVVRELGFEDGDKVDVAEGSIISFSGAVYGHKDGLVVQYIPATDATESPVLKLTINGRSKEVKERGQFGRMLIDDGYVASITPLNEKMNAGIGEALQKYILSEKLKLKDRMEKLDKKMERFTALGKLSSDRLEELQELKEKMEEYNFVDNGREEMEIEVEGFLNGTEDSISEERLKTRVQVLRDQFERVKKANRLEKFERGIIPFKDTDDDQWFTEFVSFVKMKKIVSGYKDRDGKELGEFRPGSNITVAELLKMVLEAADKGEADGSPALGQASDHWSKGYVKRGEELGLTLLENLDDLNRKATRAEVIRAALEAVGVNPQVVSSSQFPDVPVSHPALSYIEYARSIGIVSGDDDTGTFRPDEPINRAEVSKIIRNIMEIVLGDE